MKNEILFIVATHGDEQFSIPIMKQLEKKYPKEEYSYDWVVGNPEAVKKNVRFVEQDLNRSAPGNSSSSIYEEKRAAELIELSKNYDFVIDIYGSISDIGIVKIIPLPTLENILLAATIPIERSVVWFSEKSLVTGPIVQFCKCPAIEIECGSKESPELAIELEEALTQIITSNLGCDAEKILRDLMMQKTYTVIGKELNMNLEIFNFRETNINGEIYTPFLVNQYKNIKCYKIKNLSLRKFINGDVLKFIYDSRTNIKGFSEFFAG